MIEAVGDAADAAEATTVYWMTQEFSAAGRALYDTWRTEYSAEAFPSKSAERPVAAIRRPVQFHRAARTKPTYFRL